MVNAYGIRCTGTNKQCITPWYTTSNGEKGRTCPDKSDQVFSRGLTCREHLQMNIDYHEEHFCNSEYPVAQNSLICRNITQWLTEKNWNPSFSDPHNCQSSCFSADIDCVACTNPEYFNCTKSGHCLNPDLECDGHPQCTEGEDEDLDRCYMEYVKNKIIYPYSSYRCTSLFYEVMEIYAKPCDSKPMVK